MVIIGIFASSAAACAERGANDAKAKERAADFRRDLLEDFMVAKLSSDDLEAQSSVDLDAAWVFGRTVAGAKAAVLASNPISIIDWRMVIIGYGSR